MNAYRLITRFCLCILLLGLKPVIAGETLPETEIGSVTNFLDLAKRAQNQRKVIMLEFAASDCSYCRLLEEKIINPMLRSGDYDQDVLIGKVDIDDYSDVIDFNGEAISGAELAARWEVSVTPTLIFLNAQNQEVSQRIVGVNSLDYFGAYVDQAIDQGLSTIR